MENKIIAHLIKGPVDFWDLVPEFVRLKNYSDAVKSLQKKNYLIIKKSKMTLSPLGKKYAKDAKISFLPAINNYSEIKVDKKLLAKFKRLRKEIKRFLDYDQIQLTEESVMRKVEIMRRRGDLDGKDIICIGDDDMLAIAMALTKKPKSITVVDIDKNILDYENKVLKTLGYQPNCVSLNLIDGTPQEIKGKFDVFCTEPSDILYGMKVFFSRGVDCLKKEGGVGYLGVPHIYFKPSEISEVQGYTLQANGQLTDILHQFYCYRVEKGKDISWVTGLPQGVESPTKPWLYTNLYRIIFDGRQKSLLEGKADPSGLIVGSYHLE